MKMDDLYSLERFSSLEGINSHSLMVKTEVGLTRELKFMLGVSRLIFITMVWPDDVTSLGCINSYIKRRILKVTYC